ncbi:hypothetical protein AAF712_008707 [Marasmius tenuissimus]|uniref:Uncharacterized protein n=1 Tax=Marasmius tenuissimus TaxID=585030 RepID=A0ABR2ZVS8_9AGAR
MVIRPEDYPKSEGSADQPSKYLMAPNGKELKSYLDNEFVDRTKAQGKIVYARGNTYARAKSTVKHGK